MTVVKGTFYGHVRRTAFKLWSGPEYIRHKDDDNPLSGICVLRLAIRKGETAKPMIESRAVYTILDPNDPKDAILRAVYWDNKAIRHTTHSTPIDTPFTIPARFVQIPLLPLHQWIASLDNLPTTIQTSSRKDGTLPICALKVKTNVVSSHFEKTWQVVEDENTELNRAWQTIWHEMGLALQTSPVVTGLEEDFPSRDIKPEIYDVQAYQPTLTLP